MKATIILAFTTLLLAPLWAQTTQSKPAPVAIVASAFRGKSFEECEKVLGIPINVREPKADARGDERSLVRTYKSPILGIAKIELFRAPEGGENGPIAANVNYVKYHFPKGKTWKECVALIGMSPEDVTLRRESDANKPKDAVLSLIDKNRREVMWIPAAATLKWAEDRRNPDYDTLSF